MKKDWEIKKLGEVCEVIAGQSPEGKFYNQDKKGTPFYQGKKDFGLKYLDKPTVWTTVETKIALENDILMSVRAPVGDINICTSRVCIGRGLAAIRASEVVNNDFLFYFLLSIKSKITGKEGAVFASINRQEISDLTIPLPPLEEQKRIVKILDEKFAQLESLKANAQTNLQNAKDLFQSQLTKAFSNTTWEMQKLSEITEVKDGTHDSPSYYSEGIPFVTQKNITPSGFDLTNTKRISLQDHEKFYKRSNVEYGDIIIAMIGANRGMSCIVNTREVFSIKNVGLIKKSEKTNQEYLAYYLKSEAAQKYVSDASNGGAQEFIGLSSLRNFPIPLPPLHEQKCIVKELDTLSEKVRQLQEIYTKQIANCDELKQAYLQKAFEGEL